MINALSAGISEEEPGVSAEVLRSYCGDPVTQYLLCGATPENSKIENHVGLAVCDVCCSRWIKLTPVCSDHCLG